MRIRENIIRRAIPKNESDPSGHHAGKHADQDRKYYTLGISIQSDIYKNKGYGTEMERQAPKNAFLKLGMETVFADTLLDSKRSQHVLEKVGFQETHRDKYSCILSTQMG